MVRNNFWHYFLLIGGFKGIRGLKDQMHVSNKNNNKL